MAPEGETSLVVEAPCFAGDAVDRLPAEAFVGEGGRRAGGPRLLDPRHVVEIAAITSSRMRTRLRQRTTRGDVAASSARPCRSVDNLETVGRAGRFVYSHLHDQLRFGKDYVRELTAPGVAHSA